MDLTFLASILLSTRVVTAVSTFTPARPPAVPLAVKSPYLNTWLNADPDGSNHGILPGRSPQFWTYVGGASQSQMGKSWPRC